MKNLLVSAMIIMTVLATNGIAKGQGIGGTGVIQDTYFDMAIYNVGGSAYWGRNKTTDSVFRLLDGTVWTTVDSFSTDAVYTISMTCASTVLNPCSVLVEASYTTDGIIWHKRGTIGVAMSGVLSTQTNTGQLIIPNLPPNATVKITTTTAGTASGATFIQGFDTH